MGREVATKGIDWTEWSAIAEILSAVAIVITLLYLANQTKQISEQTAQNAQFLRIQTESAAVENRRAMDFRIIENPEFASLLVRAGGNADLSDTDKLRLSRLAQVLINQSEAQFNLIQSGIVEDDGKLVPGLQRLFDGEAFSVPSEIARSAWRQSAPLRGDDFVHFVQTAVLLSRRQAHSRH